MGEARSRAAWILAGMSVALTMVIGIWLVRDPVGFLPERLGVNAQALRVPWAWVLALAVAAGYSLYTLRAVPFVNAYKFEWSGLKLLGVWAALVSGVVEEVVFRQMLMDLTAAWGFAIGWQIVASAVTFGVAHAAWILFRGEIRIAVPVVASTMVLGALLAVVYLAAGRNVLPAIAAHTLINLVIEPWLILAAVSGNWTNTERTPSASTSGFAV